MDPQKTNDGKPYGPYRYKQIVKERYFISKHSNTSYVDTADITPAERTYLLEFISNDIKKQNEIIDKYKKERNS